MPDSKTKKGRVKGRPNSSSIFWKNTVLKKEKLMSQNAEHVCVYRNLIDFFPLMCKMMRMNTKHYNSSLII